MRFLLLLTLFVAWLSFASPGAAQRDTRDTIRSIGARKSARARPAAKPPPRRPRTGSTARRPAPSRSAAKPAKPAKPATKANPPPNAPVSPRRLDPLLPGPHQLLVVDYAALSVRRYNAATSQFDDVLVLPNSALGNPHNVIPGPNNSILVSNEGTHSVKQFDAAGGAFLGDAVAPGAGGMKNAIGMRYGYQGDLIVASAFTDEVKRYDGQTGAYLGVFASGFGMKTPTGITFGPNGNLFVSSSGLYGHVPKILEFDGITGAFVRVFVDGSGLDWPGDLLFGPDGHLYVSNFQGRNVLKFNGATGAPLGAVVSTPNPSKPHGLGFGPDGTLYVPLERGNAIRRHNAFTGALVEESKADNAGMICFLPRYLPSDLTGDGRSDLLFQSPNGRNVRIAWPNVAPTGFVTMTASLPENARLAAVADFNMDLRNDLVVQDTRTGAVSILFVHDFGHAVQRTVALDAAKLPPGEVAAAADFNGDGWPDLVIHDRTTRRTTILTLAGARVIGEQAIAPPLDAGWRVAGAADFDADGSPDLVIQDAAGAISIVRVSGGQAAGTVPLRAAAPGGGEIGAVGDYDGDGGPDLVLQGTSRSISVLLVENMKAIDTRAAPSALAGWKLVGPR